MSLFSYPEPEFLVRGDRNAFRKLFNTLYIPMLQRATFYVNDTAVAEDIVQETFTRLWDGRKDLGEVGNIEAYMMRWVRNDCLNYIKRQAVADKYRIDYMINEVSMQDADPEPYVIAIANLLRQLPEKRRQVLELSIFDSKSYAEIASELHISVNTVKDHIKKAYLFLRQQSRFIPYPP